ncbi:MAG: hypothetical protein K2M37_03385 [Muribaculaceae bacterium]|nr:hypothetical protein [Muribaculaceae bacterium]
MSSGYGPDERRGAVVLIVISIIVALLGFLFKFVSPPEGDPVEIRVIAVDSTKLKSAQKADSTSRSKKRKTKRKEVNKSEGTGRKKSAGKSKGKKTPSFRQRSPRDENVQTTSRSDENDR